MVKLISSIYKNTRINVGGVILQFNAGCVSVSEEEAQKVLAQGNPKIFRDGEQPTAKSKLEESDMDEQLKKVHAEYLDKLEAKDKVIEAKEREITGLNNQIIAWKKEYEQAKEALDLAKTQSPENLSNTALVDTISDEQTGDPMKEIKKELEAMTVDQLRTLLLAEPTLKERESEIKKMNKVALVEEALKIA